MLLRTCIRWTLLSSVLLVSLWACEKDAVQVDRGTPPLSLELYESFTPELERAVSLAIADPAFKEAVLVQAREQRQGDTEVLLTEVLRYGQEGVVRAALLKAAQDRFTGAELDEYLRTYPSVIIGVRGDANSWAKGQHTPPVAYVPAAFDERSPEIEGTLSGEPITIPLDRPFTDAVLAIRLSERHDRYGQPLGLPADAFDHEQVMKSRGPLVHPPGPEEECFDPTSCQSVSILSFSVEPEWGCLELSFDLGGSFITGNYCPSYLRFAITRLNPDGTLSNLSFTGDEDNSSFDDVIAFYDCDVSPNVTYFYTVAITPTYRTPQGETRACSAVQSGIVMATAPAFGQRLSTFHGENQDNTTIRYTWSAPDDNDVWQYRLSYWDGSQYVEEAILDPGDPNGSGPSNFETAYEFPHPATDRGQAVRMRIQYRPGGGAWQGDFFDKTFASFRNAHQPLYFYGIELPYTELYELGVENPINGNPEIQLIAVQGTSTFEGEPRTDVIKEIFLPTSLCEGTDFYHHSLGPVHIVDWDNDLLGTAITIYLYETDANEIVVGGQSNQTTTAHEFSAQIGFKKPVLTGEEGEGEGDGTGTGNGNGTGTNTPGNGLQIGIKSAWKQGNKVSIDFPVSDIHLGTDVLYYHEPLMLQRGNRFYGATVPTAGNICTIYESF